MTIHRLICCKNISKILPSVQRSKPLQYQYNQYQRFTHQSRSRSPLQQNESFSFIQEPLVKYGGALGVPSSSSLLKPLLFTVGFSVASFVGMTIWEYESYRTKMFQAMKRPLLSIRVRHDDLMSRLKATWNSLSPGDRFFVPICALNVIVFGLWRIPRLKPMMVTYFCSNPAAKVVCWPMLFSAFSHYSFFHIFANMYVLHSFSQTVSMAMGKEQMLGVYLTAGVVANLTSYLYKTFTGVAGFSLGASGAIMAILAYTCVKYPDSTLSIIFLPMFPFTAGAAIKCIVTADIVGCLFKWRYFDHAAHLGGALFGMFWFYIGSEEIWPKRKVILEKWHEIRSKR